MDYTFLKSIDDRLNLLLANMETLMSNASDFDAAMTEHNAKLDEMQTTLGNVVTEMQAIRQQLETGADDPEQVRAATARLAEMETQLEGLVPEGGGGGAA
jgi:DNA repair ATPase RecN